jgi:hypothetical protein
MQSRQIPEVRGAPEPLEKVVESPFLVAARVVGVAGHNHGPQHSVVVGTQELAQARLAVQTLLVRSRRRCQGHCQQAA